MGRREVAVAVGVVAVVLAAKGHLKVPAVQHGGSPATVTADRSGYVDPLAGERWVRDRIDQGFDLQPVVPTPVRAIGSGVVVASTTQAGWPGGAWIAYKLTTGPKAGAVIYVAEHMTGLARAGTRLRPGQTIATAWPGYPWTEWGYANCSGTGPVVPYDGASDGTEMAGGKAFARFMRELGAWAAPDRNAEDPGPGPDFYRC